MAFIDEVPRLVLHPHVHGVWDVKELEDGTIATSSSDMSLKVWSLRGECLFSYQHSLPISRFVELNSRQIAIADVRCLIYIVDRNDNGKLVCMTFFFLLRSQHFQLQLCELQEEQTHLFNLGCIARTQMKATTSGAW